jgi:hypothetical protein
MLPTFDPGILMALVEDKRGELTIEPLNKVCKPEVVRVSGSKSALKSWRRVHEFKAQAANGRKEVSNGNCNS